MGTEQAAAPRDRPDQSGAGHRQPGIVDIQVNIVENKDLAVGNDIMHLIVAGDIRENVISVLRETLDAIKAKVTQKTEYLKE